LCSLFIGAFISIVFLVPGSLYGELGAVQVSAIELEKLPVARSVYDILKQGNVITQGTTDNNGMAMVPLEEGDYNLRVGSQDRSLQRDITIEPGKLLSLTADFSRGDIRINDMPYDRYRPLQADNARKGYSVSSADLGGLMSYRYDIPEGSFYLGFPYYASPGDTISSYGILAASGASAREKQRNLKKMQNYRVGMNGESFPLSGPTTWETKAVIKRRITLQSKDGKKIFIEHTITIRFQDVERREEPILSTAGWPIYVPGSFDGIASNTQAQFGGTPVEVKAETPSCVFLNLPSKIVGTNALILTEAGSTTQTMVRNAYLELYADKLDLHRGESTQVHLNIKGMAGLNKIVYASLVNRSPGIVSMGGGNAQFFIIDPRAVGPAGVASYNRNLTGIRRGHFAITAVLY
jgi:hypothetical protein